PPRVLLLPHPATSALCPLSLHDALPIFRVRGPCATGADAPDDEDLAAGQERRGGAVPSDAHRVACRRPDVFAGVIHLSGGKPTDGVRLASGDQHLAVRQQGRRVVATFHTHGGNGPPRVRRRL